MVTLAAPDEVTPLDELDDNVVLALMAKYLLERDAWPVGTFTWAAAVTRYEECKREMDRRMIVHIVHAARTAAERSGQPS